MTADAEQPTTPPRRTIRSFVRREGRLTEGQARALELLWPRFGVEAGEQPIDLNTLFGREAPRVLEIGFGMGDSLAEMAAAQPDHDWLGIEVHRPGVGRLLIHVEQLGLTNLRVMCTDAVEVLQRQLADGSLDRVQIFFPDPWHKKRHHKRRLIQPPLVALLVRKLKPGGAIHLATDWEPYAQHMLAVLSGTPGLTNRSPSGDYVPRPDHRPQTKFERRGARLGHGVWDLLFTTPTAQPE